MLLTVYVKRRWRVKYKRFLYDDFLRRIRRESAEPPPLSLPALPAVPAEPRFAFFTHTPPVPHSFVSHPSFYSVAAAVGRLSSSPMIPSNELALMPPCTMYPFPAVPFRMLCLEERRKEKAC